MLEEWLLEIRNGLMIIDTSGPGNFVRSLARKPSQNPDKTYLQGRNRLRAPSLFQPKLFLDRLQQLLQL